MEDIRQFEQDSSGNRRVREEVGRIMMLVNGDLEPAEKIEKLQKMKTHFDALCLSDRTATFGLRKHIDALCKGNTLQHKPSNDARP